MLLDHGAVVNLTDARGNTVLLTQLTTRQAGYRRDHDVFTPDEIEPMSPAVLNGVRTLLEHGLDVMHANNKGMTAFDYVVAGSEVEALLREYVDRKPVMK